jgi:hypothetical protein
VPVPAIVWMSNQLARVCARAVPNALVVSSAREFLDAPRDARTMAFLDGGTLASLDALAAELGNATGEHPPERRKLLAAVSNPIVAVCGEPLAADWLAPHPWLSHLVGAALLEQPYGEIHLANLARLFASTRNLKLLDLMKPTPEGRRVRITHSSHRNQRLERMCQYYTSKGASSELVARLRDIAEGLLVNAFYDAASAAGVEAPRHKDVALPDELACDMVYGYDNDIAFVRVRDPFGSMTRQMLVDGLADHQSLWRIFAGASVAAISVIGNQQTEVLVEVQSQIERPQLAAFHVFYKAGARRGLWKTLDEDTGKPAGQSTVSVTVIPE